MSHKQLGGNNDRSNSSRKEMLRDMQCKTPLYAGHYDKILTHVL